MTPLVIAHRGASWDEPENTLRAFRRAVDAGANYVEFDVQATQDGHLVTVHDPLRETLAELRERQPDVPVLDEALEELAGRIGLCVELKHPYRHRRHRPIERTLLALDRHGVVARDLIVASFEPQAILETRRLRPRLRTLQHVEHVPLSQVSGHAWAAGIEDSKATPPRLAAAQALGLEAIVYTVNDASRPRELAALGVAGIITDRPDLIRRALSRERRRSPGPSRRARGAHG